MPGGDCQRDAHRDIGVLPLGHVHVPDASHARVANNATSNCRFFDKEVRNITTISEFSALIEGPLPARLSPKSDYLDQGYTYYFVDLEKAGQAAKIPAVAEKAAADFPDNDDALMVLMNDASVKNQSDKALNYGLKLIAAANKRAKPEGVSQADWDRKKSTELGRAYWTVGVTYGERRRYLDTDGICGPPCR